MSKVTLWPPQKNIKEVEVNSDQSLLEQLKGAGLTIESDCGGHANCGKCVVKIHTGEDHLSPSEFKELKLLGNVFHLTRERLSCQTHVVGDVTIDLSAHSGVPAKKPSKKPSNSKVHLKKSEQLKAEAMELSRQDVTPETPPEQQEADWFRHWEKTASKDDPKGKHLDGNKRPRMFKTPDGTNESEKPKKE
ncbi:MAG: hypothetical protein A2X86_14980 [Bdellovibrionales bacterium GWA2_49_15]|nr:MAG: hypothetical protein A2X86_14980 [Bdellovibrionales bacterium GWA2_49_15]HAZ13353.1 hypothetical protein [Bdellovibrionales bacterium]